MKKSYPLTKIKISAKVSCCVNFLYATLSSLIIGGFFCHFLARKPPDIYIEEQVFQLLLAYNIDQVV